MSDDTDPSAVETHVRASGMDPRVLEILICPVTRQPLEYVADNDELISRKAGLAYPIRDGLALLTEDDAREFDPDTTP